MSNRDSFLARVAELTTGEMMAIVAAGEHEDVQARRRAARSAQRAAKEAHMTREIEETRDLIIGWATDAGPATGQLPGMVMAETLEGNLRRRVAPHLIDAATAIILGDRLAPDAADALLAPWRSATAR